MLPLSYRSEAVQDRVRTRRQRSRTGRVLFFALACAVSSLFLLLFVERTL